MISETPEIIEFGKPLFLSDWMMVTDLKPVTEPRNFLTASTFGVAVSVLGPSEKMNRSHSGARKFYFKAATVCCVSAKRL